MAQLLNHYSSIPYSINMYKKIGYIFLKKYSTSPLSSDCTTWPMTDPSPGLTPSVTGSRAAWALFPVLLSMTSRWFLSCRHRQRVNPMQGSAKPTKHGFLPQCLYIIFARKSLTLASGTGMLVSLGHPTTAAFSRQRKDRRKWEERGCYAQGHTTPSPGHSQTLLTWLEGQTFGK